MPIFRKKLVEVEAHQWMKNGDGGPQTMKNEIICDTCEITSCKNNCPLEQVGGAEPVPSPLDGVVMCPVCKGDGKETCDNPDHGFINAMGWHEIGRLGCPVCGHDPDHKVLNGGDCLECGGLGKVSERQASEYLKGT